VLDGWTLDRVDIIRRHWRECGPPAHIGIAALASLWGGKLTADAKPVATDLPKTIDPNDAAFADVAMPVAGGDTMAASHAILAKLHAMHGG
jgi:hypothetical protein